MKINIHKIEEEEINLGIELLEALYSELGEESESINFLSATFLKSIFELGKTVFYMISLEDKANIGFFTLTTSQAIYAGGQYGIIDEMYVIPKYRSMKIGSSIIHEIKNIGKEKGWKRIDVTNYNESELFQSKDIIGKVTKNGIAKDTPFNVKDLSSDMIIKRGQNIYIIAQSGAVQIKTIGTALQNGGVGDFIRVKREGQGNAVLVGEVDMNGAVILRSARASLK